MNSVLIDQNVQIFFLVFARIFAMLEMVPIVSNSGMNFTARAGLSFFTASVISPVVVADGYPLPDSGLDYTFLVLGEALIGLIMGFFLTIIFAIAASAGQMFSMQMGFGATEAYDPMSGAENPVMGQLLNLAGFMVFLSTFGMQKLFLMGVQGSFNYFTAAALVLNTEVLSQFMTKGVVALFGQAMIIAMPMMGSLFLVSVTMGLLSKAAPQMNLMMVGFPIQLAVGFLIVIVALPNILNAFNSLFDVAWSQLDRLFWAFKQSVPL